MVAYFGRQAIGPRQFHVRQHNPSKAGSVAFCVDGFEMMRRELVQTGRNPGEFGINEWDGGRHPTFFVREGDNGYCFASTLPCQALKDESPLL